MMILAQHLPVKKERISDLMQAFRDRGYTVNDLTDIDESLMFDVESPEDEMLFCRFLLQDNGDIRGIQMLGLDHYGLEQFLEIMRPFLTQGTKPPPRIIITGEHQEELEGYYILRLSGKVCRKSPSYAVDPR